MNIPIKEVTNSAMIAGNEKKYTHIILNNIVKQWVGIGWIDLHIASTKDLEKYPTVGDT